MSVPRAQKPAFGMSRTGLCDSSAASGSSSMPRKNHIANGRANRIGKTRRRGRNVASGPRVGGHVPQVAPTGTRRRRPPSAEKTRMMPMEMIETTIANLKEMLAPAALSAMKTRYRTTYQIHITAPRRGSKPSSSARDRVGVRREKKTMTAVVATYSMVSAAPVTRPPQRTHRGSGEGVRAAGVRHRRRHLPDREDHAVVHRARG